MNNPFVAAWRATIQYAICRALIPAYSKEFNWIALYIMNRRTTVSAWWMMK